MQSPFDSDMERIMQDAMLRFLDNARRTKRICTACKVSLEETGGAVMARVVNRLHFFCYGCGAFQASMLINEPTTPCAGITEDETEQFKRLLETPKAFESEFYAYARSKGVTP